ncbi:YdeI/OmpD-associated family protein [Dysgonomonadaceae bacterium zrk40]|nr:YdeI/OmpD-associated family protein [Dysgonomonadaceae bacterium zrk40]
MNENESKSKRVQPTKESLTFFQTENDFREWLEGNHEKETELMVGFYKVNSDKPSMTWSQSVDQALCFGWIDGIRRSIDEESYCIRFTPRRNDSNWSAVNIKKIEELTKAGLMKPAGVKAFSLRKEDKSEIYSYENDATILDSRYEIQFRENKKAWEFIMNQAPSYRKAVMRWIMGAKQEETRQARLVKTINQCEQQKRLT